jgi:hypothetical protein
VGADRSQQIGAERQTSSSNVREDINAGESLAALVSRDSGHQSTWAQLLLAQQVNHQEQLHNQNMRQTELSFTQQLAINAESAALVVARNEAQIANSKMANGQRANQDGNVADRLTNLNEDSNAAVQLAAIIKAVVTEAMKSNTPG